MTTLILASRSPRRRELLAALGLHWKIVDVGVDESPWALETPWELALRLAMEKVWGAWRDGWRGMIVGADTVVDLDGEALGKPRDAVEAVEMLKVLRGRAHEVHTGVAVLTREMLQARVETTRVWMREYTDAEIEAYVASGDPLDKAGAYAIQHPTFRPVARWEGCYANVVGLPLALTVELLRASGVEVSVDVGEVCERLLGQRCCVKDMKEV